MARDTLQDELTGRLDVYSAALDRLRDIVERDTDPLGPLAARDLREAVELVRCLRRLLAGRSVDEIHRAFGAPGDFGYDSAIGDALSKVYRGEIDVGR